MANRNQGLSVLFTLSCSAFLLLTGWAATGRYLPGEQALLTSVIAHRLSILNEPALLISTLGSMNILLPLWALLVVAFALLRQGEVLGRLIPVPLGYPLYALVKSLIPRAGPTPPEYPWLYDWSIGYYVEGLLHRQLEQLPSQGVAVPVVSQPVTAQVVTQVMERGYVSGHALVAMIFYGTLTLWVWRMAAAPRRRALGIGLLAFMAIAVGLVRIYMGVHFPSDVLGAWLLGIIFVWIVDHVVGVLAPRLQSWLRRTRGRRMAHA